MSADYQEVYRYLDDLQKQAYDRGYKDGMTAAEAIAKIKEYEESKGKHKINVGDEVLNIFGDRGYVTSVGDGELCVLYPNGSTGHSSKSTYTKTGKHCKEIAELLRKVGENK